jgi:hypothetical protein
VVNCWHAGPGLVEGLQKALSTGSWTFYSGRPVTKLSYYEVMATDVSGCARDLQNRTSFLLYPLPLNLLQIFTLSYRDIFNILDAPYCPLLVDNWSQYLV